MIDFCPIGLDVASVVDLSSDDIFTSESEDEDASEDTRLLIEKDDEHCVPKGKVKDDTDREGDIVYTFSFSGVYKVC